MSSSAFPADPALPALPEALDPAAMLEALREHLGDPSVPMAECLITRIRYRRAERAVIQYSLRSDGGRPDRDRWVTGLLYPGDRPSQVWRKISRALPAHSRAGSLPLAAFVPELGMVLQVFPFDRRLPSLRVLADPPAEVVPTNGGPRSRVEHVEAVRYRAGLSCTLRWDLPDAGTRWYVKAYRDGQATQTLRLLRALGTGEDRGFVVAEPIAELKDLGALVLAQVAGTPLSHLLMAADDPTAPMEPVAEALARFHRIPPVTTRRHGPEAELADVRRAGAIIGWVRPELAAAVEDVVRSIAGRLEPASSGSVHRDLKPDHLVVGPERVALLDVDSMALADPVLDPAALVARLTGLAERHPERRSIIDQAAQTFMDRYFASVPDNWRERFPPRLAGALLEEAAGCFRRQEMNWPELIQILVGSAGRALRAPA